MYRKKKKPFELPEFIFDQYTSFGKSALKKENKSTAGSQVCTKEADSLCGASHIKWGENQPSYTTKETPMLRILSSVKRRKRAWMLT